MDINKYIAEGILEFYILGITSEEESQEIEKLLKLHPELRNELYKIEDALLMYSQVKAIPMPKDLIVDLEKELESEENDNLAKK